LVFIKMKVIGIAVWKTRCREFVIMLHTLRACNGFESC
jgi:hypothetical protein